MHAFCPCTPPYLQPRVVGEGGVRLGLEHEAVKVGLQAERRKKVAELVA
jgi:hypothetical protein